MSENEKKDKTARDIMNLDEAIQHCEEVATSKTKQVENGDWEKGSSTERDCIACASEHRQLAEWLKELKAYRNKSEIPTSCGDAISRQAVLNAMYELCDTGETLKENPWRDNPHIDGVVEAIEELPSVTPQQRTGQWIDAEVLDNIRAEIETDLSHFCFDEWGNENPTWKEIKAIIGKYKAESEE